MQKKLYPVPVIFIALSHLFFSCKPLYPNTSNKDPLRERWQEVPPLIDGDDNDWDLKQCIVDDNNHITYNITNDNSRVYVLMKTDNDQLKTRILEAGMYLYINTEGKRKETAAIIFPTSHKSSYKPIFRKIQKIDSLGCKKYLKDLNVFSIFGLGMSSENAQIFSTENNDTGIEVKIGFDKNFNLIYEAAIPSNLLVTTDITGMSKQSKVVAFGFGINAFPKPASVNDLDITAKQFDDELMPPPVNKEMKLTGDDLFFHEIKVWCIIKMAQQEMGTK